MWFTADWEIHRLDGGVWLQNKYVTCCLNPPPPLCLYLRRSDKFEDRGWGNGDTKNMEEESEREARQTGGGVGWQNIWRLTAGMCRNQGMNNWKGDRERDRNTEGKKETESKQKPAGRGGLGQPSPISLLGLFVSSIDQIKFLLPVYSTRAMSSPRSTPSPAHSPSPSPAQNHSPSLCPLYDFARLRRAFFCFTTVRFMPSILARATPFCECSSQIKSKQLFFHFVNEPSTAISNFTAMNPCGFWSGRDQQIEGGGSTQRVVKAWREESIRQSRTGVHINTAYSVSGRLTSP